MSRARIRNFLRRAYKVSTSKTLSPKAAQGSKPFGIRLPETETQRLREAAGWLELGDASMSRRELDKITRQWRLHPDVLEVRWQVFAHTRKWKACVDIADVIVQLAPDRPFGWIHRSYALCKLNRTQEAYDRLLPALEKFPEESIIACHLAWYSGRVEELSGLGPWADC